MNIRHWISGARPRTLPAAFAPVIAGTGVAAFDLKISWLEAALALGVAVSLQIGVNYANDYSDGIRGTDEKRVGPQRLVAANLASAKAVKIAALAFLGLGALFGFALAALTSWWLLAVGVLAILAAWGYTGGSNPYGYRGLGEVSVFIFFGLIAVVGTTYVQTRAISTSAILAGVGVGALACAILVANNLRDIPTDTAVGKRTLAVALGDQKTRVSFVALIVLAFASAAVIARLATPWALLAFVALPLAVRASHQVMNKAKGMDLVSVLKTTGIIELLWAVGLAAGLVIGS